MARPPASPKDNALIQVLSSGTVTVIAVALLLFGSPAKPGERRNALFLALEEMLGYHETCGLMVAIGAVWLAWSLFRWRKAARAEAAPPAR
jgi:Na+/melibiose symporter-like transporter